MYLDEYIEKDIKDTNNSSIIISFMITIEEQAQQIEKLKQILLEKEKYIKKLEKEVSTSTGVYLCRKNNDDCNLCANKECEFGKEARRIKVIRKWQGNKR